MALFQVIHSDKIQLFKLPKLIPMVNGINFQNHTHYMLHA